MKNKLLTMVILISLTGGIGSTTVYAKGQQINESVICQDVNANQEDSTYNIEYVKETSIINEEIQEDEISFTDKILSFWNKIIEFFTNMLDGNKNNEVSNNDEEILEEENNIDEVIESIALDSKEETKELKDNKENISDVSVNANADKVEVKNDVIQVEQKKEPIIIEKKVEKVEVQETVKKEEKNTQENIVNLQQVQSGQTKEFLAQVEQSIFKKVNEERRKKGVPELKYDYTVERYARIKSQDMGDNNYFSHTDTSGKLISDKMKIDGVGFSAWGENIAYIGGNSDPEVLANQFMNNWMNSEGHKQNILSTNYSNIGVGVYKIGNKVYATQEFKR